MNFVNWLVEEKGYKAKYLDGKKFIDATYLSSLGQCTHGYVKDNSVFVFGLGQKDLPPYLIHPILPQSKEKMIGSHFFCREFISSSMVNEMDFNEAFEILYPFSLRK